MITGSYKNGESESVFKGTLAIILSLSMVIPNRGFAAEGEPIKNLPVPYKKNLPVPYEKKAYSNPNTGTAVVVAETIPGIKDYKLEELSYQHVIDGKFPHRRFEAEVMGNQFYEKLGIRVGYDFKNNKKYIFGYYDSKVRVVVTEINPPPVTFKSSMKAFAESMKTAGGAAKEAGKELFSVRTPPTIVGFLAGMGAYAWGRAIWDPLGAPGSFSYSIDQNLSPLGVAGIGVFIAAAQGSKHIMVPAYLKNPTNFNRRMITMSSLFIPFAAQSIFMKLAEDQDVKECYKAVFVNNTQSSETQFQVGAETKEFDPITLGYSKVADVASCVRVGEKFANGEVVGEVLSSMISLGVGFAMMEGATAAVSKSADAATEYANAKRAKYGELGAALKDSLQRARVQGKKFFMGSSSTELKFALRNYIPGVGLKRGILLGVPRLAAITPIGRVVSVGANIAMFAAFTEFAEELVSPFLRGSIGARDILASESEMMMSYLRARKSGFTNEQLSREFTQLYKEYSAETKSWADKSNLEFMNSFNHWTYKTDTFVKEYMRTQQFYKSVYLHKMVGDSVWSYPIFTSNEDYLLRGYLSGRTVFGNFPLDVQRLQIISRICDKMVTVLKAGKESLIPGRSNAQLAFNAQLLSTYVTKFLADQMAMANAKTLPEFHRKALVAQTADIASLIRWFSGFLKEYVEFQKDRLFVNDPLFQRVGLRKMLAQKEALANASKVTPGRVLKTAADVSTIPGVLAKAGKVINQYLQGQKESQKENQKAAVVQPDTKDKTVLVLKRQEVAPEDEIFDDLEDAQQGESLENASAKPSQEQQIQQVLDILDPSNIEYLTLMSLINMNPVIAPGRSFGLGIIAMNGFYKEDDPGLNDDLYFRMSLGINVGQVPVWSKADFWIASMLCGPDTTKGESIVASNKILDYVKYGKPPTFLAPKFVDGDTSKICGNSAPSTNVGLGDHLEQLHTPANVSKWSLVAPLENYKGSEKIPGIYYGNFPYNGKSYSSFVDVIQAGLPSKLVANNESDSKSEEIALASFNEKWGRLTEPQVRPLIKTWARDYLQMLSEKFFPRNTLVSSYSGQMQQLSNDSVSMIIYQQGMTALTLLNDMLTRYQNNISRDLLEKGDGVEYSPIAKAFGATNSAFRENLGKTVTIGQVFMYNWNKPEMNLGKILQPFSTAILRNGNADGLLKQFENEPSKVLSILRQAQQELKVLMGLAMRTSGADGIFIRPNCPPSELMVLKKSPLYIDRAEIESPKTNYTERTKAIQRTKKGIDDQYEKLTANLAVMKKSISGALQLSQGDKDEKAALSLMYMFIEQVETAGTDLAKISLMQLLAYKSYLE